jgi:hypothetical protein
VNHFELVAETKEALGVSNKEIAFGVQATPELLDQARLLR